MKKIINLVVVVLMLTTLSVSAKSVVSFDEDLPKAVKVMSEMIKNNLLNSENLEIEQDTQVKINFTINSDNELILLDIKTDERSIKDYIKWSLSSLNIKDANLVVGKNYSVIINFMKLK